jgi:hypothetical protein
MSKKGGSMKKRQKAKSTYRSPESRARQLAGLANVKVEGVEKVNGKGLFASVTEEVRKEIIDLFCKGHSCRYIGNKVGLSAQTVDDVKNYYLDEDGQFRNTLFQINMRTKLQTVVDGALDRVTETLSEMSPKDSAIVLGVAMDKLMALDKSKTPEQLHQHLHVHSHTDAYISSEIQSAMKPKNNQ